MASRIYTRTGDSGNTGLFGGERVAKDDLRVEAYGAVDELNASLGAARALGFDPEIDTVLCHIQHDLFQVGADLATPEESKLDAGRRVVKRIDGTRAERLEASIDKFEAELSPLQQFVLPGGHPTAAALHISRTICRRAERRCVTLARRAEADGETANPEIVRYLNRLSDLLFVLARAANRRNSVPDVNWNSEV